MSHNVAIEPEEGEARITDLSLLARAAESLGLKFMWGQDTFQSWYQQRGSLVGDYPIPEGFTKEDMGTCLHAIVNPNAEGGGNQSYEIGVVESKKHPGTYALLYDFWGGALEKKIGNRAGKLLMMYNIECAKEIASNVDNNFQLLEDEENPGEYVMVVDTTERLGY